MTAQNGASVVVSVKNASNTYEALAGMRNRSIRLNSEAVDVTNADSTGRFREILDTAGVQSVTISGDGVTKDAASDGTLINMQISGDVRDCKFLVPNVGTFEGPFKCTSYETGAAFNKEVTFSATFESAGVITFTSIP